MDAAALLSGTLEAPAQGRHQAGVLVGDDELHPWSPLLRRLVMKACQNTSSS
jgi:hypothetical protein